MLIFKTLNEALKGKVIATASTKTIGSFEREGLVDNHNYAIISVHKI